MAVEHAQELGLGEEVKGNLLPLPHSHTDIHNNGSVCGEIPLSELVDLLAPRIDQQYNMLHRDHPHLLDPQTSIPVIIQLHCLNMLTLSVQLS